MFSLIVSRTKNGGIGKDNQLVHIDRADMDSFVSLTKNQVVIMGSRTFDSLNNKPLTKRINIVITTKRDSIETNEASNFDSRQRISPHIVFVDTIDSAVRLLTKHHKDKKWWVIGGESIYTQFIDLGLIKEMYITETDMTRPADAFFTHDPVSMGYDLVSTVQLSSKCRLDHYKKENKEEQHLLDTMREIVETGSKRMDRTGTGTRSVFGKMFKYKITSIEKNGDTLYSIPMLTTKKLFLRGVFEELMWFLRGQTDSKILEDKKVNIWKLNSTRDFLDSRGLEQYNEGECGPIYGFQWRNWGAEYTRDTQSGEKGLHHNGIDQVQKVIDSLITDPFSRRHIVSGWNVSDLEKMSLPPCFVRDTPVLTKKGYKMIQDVNESDLLYTHESRWKPIVNIQTKKHIGNLYGIHSDINSEPIIATGEHPFLVCTKNASMVLKSGKTLMSYSDPEWVDAKDLVPGKHCLCTPISKINKYPYITVAIDEDCVYSRPLVDNHNMFEIGRYFGMLGIENVALPPSWTIYSELKDDNIPHWVYDLPKQDIYEFLNGYNDVRGYTNKPDTMYMSANTIGIALGLQLLYSKLGIYVKIQTCNPNINQNATYRVSYTRNDSTTVMGSYMISDIIDIEVFTNQHCMVYNFEVESDNTYCVQNVAVHNCHVLYQFMVKEDDRGQKLLSLMMTQRSCDTFLGLPFNITSLGLLLLIVAKRVNMIPDEIIHSVADMHIYETHIDAVMEQVEREPYQFPYLLIKNEKDKIEEYEFTDIELHNYFSHAPIKAPMAA